MSDIDVSNLDAVPSRYKKNLVNYMKAAGRWKRYQSSSPYRQYLQDYVDLLETTSLDTAIKRMTPDQLSAYYPSVISVADGQEENNKYISKFKDDISAEYESFSQWYAERKTELSITDFILKTNISDSDITSIQEVQRAQYSLVLKKYITTSDKFEGKNKTKSSRKLYGDRINYIVNARQPGYMKETIGYRDFSKFESVFYGRVDANQVPRILNPNYLKQVAVTSNNVSATKPIRLVQPVADAAQDFIRHFQEAYASGKINKQLSFLSSPKIIKGYTSIYEQYNSHIRSMLGVFINTYLVKYEERYRGLTSLEDFVDAFLDFNKEYKSTNVLLSSFVLSRECDPHVSGLMFSMADLRAGDDQIKYDDFINTRNSYFYRQLAINYGFNIDINKPWTLVADLESPAFEKYLLKYVCAGSVGAQTGQAIDATSKFFDNFYSVAYYKDIELLKNQILTFYNIFVANNPNRTSVSNGQCGIALKIFQRSQVSQDFVDLSYEDSDWIQFYVDLRAAQLDDGILEEAKINEIKRHALAFLQVYDLPKSIFYVNLEIQKKISNRRGTFAKTNSIVNQQAPEVSATNYTTSPNDENYNSDGTPVTLEESGADIFHEVDSPAESNYTFMDGGITPLGEEFSNEEEL
jgi:hypothetical protein